MHLAGEVESTEGESLLQFYFDEGEMTELIYIAIALDLKEEDDSSPLIAYRPDLFEEMGLETQFHAACEDNDVSLELGYTLLQLGVHNALRAAVEVKELDFNDDCDCSDPHEKE